MSNKTGPASLLCQTFLLLAFLAIGAALPMAEASSDRFVAVSCSSSNVMALSENGTVWTWGRIYWGYENGSCEWYDQTTPVQVPIENVTAISSGTDHSVALKSDGTVWAWGYNYWGELGDGTRASEPLTPVQVVGLNNVESISAGNGYTIALKNDGTVWAWGMNNIGQLGDGTRENRYTPVMVKGLTDVVAIKGAALAIKEDGTVWSWRPGLFGVDEGNESSMAMFMGREGIPFQIQGLKNVRDIDTSISHTVFVKEDGTVWSWGHSGYGTLGDGTMIEINAPFITTPVQARGLINVKSVSSASVALKNDGTVWVWGYNNFGKHGDGKSFDAKAVPTQVPGMSDVIAIASGSFNTVFLKKDGSVWTCGANNCGQIGDGTRSDWVLDSQNDENDKRVPVRVLGSQGVVSMAQANDTLSPGPSRSSGFDLSTIITMICLLSSGGLVYSALRKSRNS
ncbi:regulator of chromosome condensation RCC1 [Methanocella conradii HZ254]|uniref:Regulator of chromosome condensation RCC1 n=1 Tax=Methanocella conradii (strain DSM 24694 / JCM 17849 / CGMCC 1.5162 / HZ254) TaxID=1041930 RepID=H8I7R1_METCZ|nr:chromosome condensation regulator RCC1 [Methanocella conradii]AFC99896.1 regulator of chromosome condensation RCC1 [Methanocella conradii HZ254]